MLSNLSLSQKAIFVLASALLIQVAFINALALMQRNAVQEIERGLQIESIIRHLTTVSNLWSRLATNSFRVLVHQNAFASLPLPEYKDQFARQFTETSQLVSRQGDRDEIEALQFDTEHAISMLAKLKKAREANNSSGQREYMTEIGLLADGSIARSNKLIDRFLIEQQQNDLAQARWQTSWWAALVVGLALNFLLVVACAYLFIKNVAFKYAVITDNSFRLAEGMALLPPLLGRDEISMLDREFHKMADMIVAAQIKERAVVDNALDLICSLSEEGTFIDVNPAAQVVLGYRPDELVGRSYAELVVDEDKERISTVMCAIAAGEIVPAFEHSLVRKNGSIVAVQLSCHWSRPDKVLFCVIHDITQYHRIEKLKRRFTDEVTLSLRSPLVSTRETLQSLSSVSDDTRAIALVKEANLEIKPIHRLISDLLELEKIDAAMLTLKLEQVALAAVITEAVESVQGQSLHKNIVFKPQLEESVIQCDGSRLLQAFTILLHALVRKSQADAEIVISCRLEELAQIDLKYRGSPFTADEQLHLVESFSDADSESDAMSLQSAHLSLTICRTLIEAHRGTIGISSTDRGEHVLSVQIPTSQ